MQFGLQKVKWNNNTLTADVLDDNENTIRTIKYTRAEYNACKQLYIQKGGKP